MNPTEPLASQEALSPKRATLLQVTKAMLWGLLGVRKFQSYEDDITTITPKQAIIGALIGGVMFVGSVLLMVNLAIKYLS